MKTIDNSNILIPLLEFDSEDVFYHLQIIRRKKEHPELDSNSRVVKTYYVQSQQYLWDKMPEIRMLCDFSNARACLNLNRRSFEKTAYHLLKKVTEQICNKDFRSCRKAYESVVGANGNPIERKWVIDCDDMPLGDVEWLASALFDIEPVGEKQVCIIPTKNGYHLITRPFNVRAAHLKPAIHKDNPTLLYMPLI